MFSSLHTLGLQRPSLPHQVLHGRRPVKAAHEGNRAEGTGVIAPFADLQERGVGGFRGEDPERALHGGDDLPLLRKKAPAPELRDQLLQLRESQEEVDFGDLPAEIVLVALDHAAHRHNGPHLPLAP